MTGAHFIVVMVTFPGGLSRARAILAERFGHGGFRPAQLRVAGPLLAGRDVLAVLPTGGEVALLPATGSDGGRPHARGVAPHLADAGPGGGAATAGHRRRLRQQPAHA